MQESLVYQSKELLQKLVKNSKNNSNCSQVTSSNISENAFNLLEDPANQRCTFRKHSLEESIPKNYANSVLSRSAYLSRTVPRRNDYVKEELKGISTLNTPKSILEKTDLLGYDWIASMMENSNKENQLDKPESFYNELDRFRRKNKKLCIASDNRNQPHGIQKLDNNFKISMQRYEKGNFHLDNVQRPVELNEDDAPKVYSYTLNERLFPVPLDLETANRPPPDKENPHIIKISVPSNRFVHPKIQGHINQNSTRESVSQISTARSCWSDQSSLKQKQQKNSDNNNKLIGESVGLRNHCAVSNNSMVPKQPKYDPTSSNPTSSRSIFPSHTVHTPIQKHRQQNQEPAGLRGNLIGQNGLDSPNDWLNTGAPIRNINQPRTEQEAIDQLMKSKSRANLSRTLPSDLNTESRFQIHEGVSLPEPSILQTRINLQELDDFSPRNPHYHILRSRSNSNLNTDHQNTGICNDSNNDSYSNKQIRIEEAIPSGKLSRKNMNLVYHDAMHNISNNPSYR